MPLVPLKEFIQKPTTSTTLGNSLDSYIKRAVPKPLPVVTPAPKPTFTQRFDTALQKTANAINVVREPAVRLTQKILPTPSPEDARKQGLISMGKNPISDTPLYLDATAGVGSLKNLSRNVFGKAAQEVSQPTTVSKLVAAIKSSKPIRGEAEALYTAERAKRAAIGSQVLSNNSGKAGFIKALGTLKGELPKPRYETALGIKNVPQVGDTITTKPGVVGTGNYKIVKEDPTTFEVRRLTEKGHLSNKVIVLNKSDIGAISSKGKLLPEEVDDLFDMIKTGADDYFDQITAFNGLSKILGTKYGGIPNNSELKLLQKIFGSELVQAVRTKRPWTEKAAEGIAEVLNIPRALMASMDMSFPGRQGRIFASAYPKEWGSAFKQMFKNFGSEKIYQAAMEDIFKRPTARIMKQSGLALTDATDDAIGLANKEEGFMTNLAAKIPIAGRLVKASERAYVGFANKVRADVFDKLAKQYMGQGISFENSPELYKQLANFINTATGRGSLGRFNSAAPILNAAFFSPKLIASRFNMLLNPVFYAKQPPLVRKEAAKAMVKFVLSGIAINEVAKRAGAGVESDPRSSDFGKIRVGNTRYDPWAGFQQWARLVAQLVTGEFKSSNTGKIWKLSEKEFPYTSRLDQTINFFIGKTAPIPSLIADIMRGQDLVGNELKFPQEAYEKVMPLYIGDLKEAIKELGPKALLTVGLPAFFGVGTQTYEIDPKTQEKNDTQKHKDRVRGVYDRYKQLIDEGRGQEAQDLLNDLSEDDYKLFNNIRAATRRKETLQKNSTDHQATAQDNTKLTTALKYLNNVEIEFTTPERQQLTIGAAPKRTLSSLWNNFTQAIKDKLPFFDNKWGKALKEEAYREYAFTEDIKKQLNKTVVVRDATPEFDLILGLKKDKSMFSPEGSGGAEFGAKYFFGTVKKQFIETKESPTSTIAHELLHAVNDNREFDARGFNKIWEAQKNANDDFGYPAILHAVDDILDASNLYKSVDEHSRADERFAYFGQVFGKAGLSEIPGPLQPYYQGIFK